MSRKTQSLYSHFDYTSVIWIYFNSIQPTKHYLEEHAKDVPWYKVVELVLTQKNPKKKGEKFEIKTNNYYILFEIKNKTMRVINAKKRK